jgi:hypothetical protein
MKRNKSTCPCVVTKEQNHHIGLKSCATTHHAGVKRERRYSSYSFLTSALDGVSGQRHGPAAIYPPGKEAGTHWTGSWVCLRAGLDKDARKKSLPLLGIKPRSSKSLVSSKKFKPEIGRFWFSVDLSESRFGGQQETKLLRVT